MSTELLDIIDDGIEAAEQYLKELDLQDDYTHDFEGGVASFTLGWDSISKKILANAWFYDNSLLPLSQMLFKHKKDFFVHLPGFLQFCKDQCEDCDMDLEISKAGKEIESIISKHKSSKFKK